MRKRTIILVVMLVVMFLFTACAGQEEMPLNSDNMTTPTVGLIEKEKPTLSPTPTKVPSPTPTKVPKDSASINNTSDEVSVNIGIGNDDKSFIDLEDIQENIGADIKETGVSMFREGITCKIEDDKVMFSGEGCLHKGTVERLVSPEQLEVLTNDYEDIALVIDEGITEIGIEAFVSLKYLGERIKSVEVAGSVKRIGDRAFQDLKMKSVIIKNGVKEIGCRSFYNCTKLCNISIPESVVIIDDEALVETEWIERYKDDYVIVNGNLLLSRGEVSELNVEAIQYMTDRSLRERNNVYPISYYEIKDANRDDNGLVIINGVLLDAYGVSGNLIIPNDVKYIAPNAFAFCNKLESVVLPEGLERIGAGAFAACANLKSVSIPESVEYIGGAAFCECTSLKEIILPENVSSIQSAVFAGCTSLSKVHLPEMVKYIGAGAFEECESLMSIDIPKELVYLDENAFYGCKSLNGILLPDGLVCIESAAFAECENLSDVGCGEEIEHIGYNAFAETSWIKQKLLQDDTVVVNGILIDANVLNGKVKIPREVYKIADGAFCGKDLISIDIPNHVHEIGKRAFANCVCLEEVELPKKLSVIEDELFDGCIRLKEIELPKSLTVIGEASFAGCESLNRVDIPDSVTLIRPAAFANCSKLEKVELSKKLVHIYSVTFMSCSELTNIIIPSGVESIRMGAFEFCDNLSTIVIPRSVTRIEVMGNIVMYDGPKIYCEAGTYAEQFAKEQNIEYEIYDELY